MCPDGNVKVKRLTAPAPFYSHRPTSHVNEPGEQPNPPIELLRLAVSVNVYLDFFRLRLDDGFVSSLVNNPRDFFTRGPE